MAKTVALKVGKSPEDHFYKYKAYGAVEGGQLGVGETEGEAIRDCLSRAGITDNQIVEIRKAYGSGEYWVLLKD